MRDYEFTVIMNGHGDSPAEAWQDLKDNFTFANMPEDYTCLTPGVNRFYGHLRNFRSHYEKGFETKPVHEYSFDEWLQNIFISPCENQTLPFMASLMDKRMGTTYSPLTVQISPVIKAKLSQSAALAREYVINYFIKYQRHI